MSAIVLSAEEVIAVAGGLTKPREQLVELHRRGFYRAWIIRGAVLLERPHYEAVSGGRGQATPQPITDISAAVSSCRPKRRPSQPIDWDAPTALYLHFDKKERLLYVGIASDPKKRESAHRCYAEWREKIHHIAVEWHPTRHAAVAAERSAIAAERPKYNILHQERAPC